MSNSRASSSNEPRLRERVTSRPLHFGHFRMLIVRSSALSTGALFERSLSRRRHTHHGHRPPSLAAKSLGDDSHHETDPIRNIVHCSELDMEIHGERPTFPAPDHHGRRRLADFWRQDSRFVNPGHRVSQCKGSRGIPRSAPNVCISGGWCLSGHGLDRNAPRRVLHEPDRTRRRARTRSDESYGAVPASSPAGVRAADP
jgi:hypothetical protein